MFKIGSLLPNIIKKAGINKEVKESQAVNYFKELKDFYLGEEGKRVRVMYLKNSNLVIACLSDSVVKKLQDNESEILEKINKRFGEGIIKNIRYLT